MNAASRNPCAFGSSSARNRRIVRAATSRRTRSADRIRAQADRFAEIAKAEPSVAPQRCEDIAVDRVHRRVFRELLGDLPS